MIVFYIYYFGTPLIIILSYVCHVKLDNVYYRVGYVATIIFLLNVCFSINIICVKLSKSAHKSYSVIYSILAKRVMTVRTRLKVMAFLESLSEVDIGFYCYDWFPMNNKNFFSYCFMFAFSYLFVYNMLTYDGVAGIPKFINENKNS